jgi:hypothetical protein
LKRHATFIEYAFLPVFGKEKKPAVENSGCVAKTLELTIKKKRTIINIFFFTILIIDLLIFNKSYLT